MLERFRHLGLQRRIMLFVVLGLGLLFGVLALLGLGAIDQATNLVFQERLATAQTTAAIIDQDLAQVATDAREEGGELGIVSGGTVAPGAAQALLGRLTRSNPSPFFRVARLWIVNHDSTVLDAAAVPGADASQRPPPAALALAGGASAGLAAGPPIGPGSGGVDFMTVAAALSGEALAPTAIIDLVSINATVDYVPGAYGASAPGPGIASPAPTATSGGYHLEVVDPTGIAVLGIGSDEHPGQVSKHWPKIQPLMATGSSATLVHQPGPGETFEPHVMAVTPLQGTPMYVVLEQPTDVALALPNELQQRLFLAIALGFIAALAVAWITTRHVVKPTEELTAAAGRMAAGDLASPIRVRAEDEVDLLAGSLEAMRAQLAAARAAAERTNRELEARVAERTARLNSVLEQTIDAQEAERARLARELHDETAQSLAALGIALDRARDELARSPEAGRQLIAEARATAGRLLAETRRLMLGLRPSALDDLGLEPAIRAFAEATLGPAGVEWAVDASGSGEGRLPGHVETALYRIVQEAITNIAHHARARHVTIRLVSEPTAMRITVTDDGVGFEVAATGAVRGPASATGGLGLVGIEERAYLLGGTVTIRSADGHGTSIEVWVPIDAGAR